MRTHHAGGRLGLLACLAALVLAGCGGGSGKGDETGTGSGAPVQGKQGGKITMLWTDDVDFIDPGQTYYTGGFQVIYATQTPLYIPKPPIGDAEPGLAESKPEISDDKKSVTVTLKKGVKFGPPVNREIQAKDVKYAFERAATKNVPNQ